jgi:hypothetical protein
MPFLVFSFLIQSLKPDDYNFYFPFSFFFFFNRMRNDFRPQRPQPFFLKKEEKEGGGGKNNILPTFF